MIARHCASLGLALGLISPAYRAVAAQGVQGEHTAPAPIRPNSRFTLTPTQNTWASLLLDSSTGRIWQVHFAVSDSLFAAIKKQRCPSVLCRRESEPRVGDRCFLIAAQGAFGRSTLRFPTAYLLVASP